MNSIIEYPKEVLLPEKFYEACVTYNIINFFDEKRAEKVFPFSVSPVQEKTEGYDFAYEIKNKFFMLQFKRPYKKMNGYSWKINIDQLNVIVRNEYGSVVYYALPQFEDYKLWYQALNYENMKFIDATSLQKYIVGTGKKSINSSYEKLKNWDQVVYELFGMNCYNSIVHIEDLNYQEQLITLLKLEGMVGYEVE